MVNLRPRREKQCSAVPEISTEHAVTTIFFFVLVELQEDMKPLSSGSTDLSKSYAEGRLGELVGRANFDPSFKPLEFISSLYGVRSTTVESKSSPKAPEHELQRTI